MIAQIFRIPEKSRLKREASLVYTQTFLWISFFLACHIVLWRFADYVTRTLKVRTSKSLPCYTYRNKQPNISTFLQHLSVINFFLLFSAVFNVFFHSSSLDISTFFVFFLLIEFSSFFSCFVFFNFEISTFLLSRFFTILLWCKKCVLAIAELR